MTNVSGPDFITLLVRGLEVSYNFYREKIGFHDKAMGIRHKTITGQAKYRSSGSRNYHLVT